MIFVDQLALTEMSALGDSGSLIQAYANNEVIGLLFAGGRGVTFANKAEHVFSNLIKAGKAKFVGMDASK